MRKRTHIISLKVEQRETIIQCINFNSWDLDEMLFKEGSTCLSGHKLMIMTSKGHSTCISQNENCDECPHCLCKPCITDEQNRHM